jgi:hypothetical protein
MWYFLLSALSIIICCFDGQKVEGTVATTYSTTTAMVFGDLLEGAYYREIDSAGVTSVCINEVCR